MVKLKTQDEIEIMAKGGAVAAQVLKETLSLIKEGVATLELDRFAEARILSFGAKPSFKGFEGYPYSTCININEGIVHGLPKAKDQIKRGDVVSVDLGVFFQGFHTDVSWSVLVGDKESYPEQARFLKIGQLALEQSIKICHVGNRIGDISATMQEIVEKAGFSVARDLVGHGVGQNLHEEPQVPCFGQRGKGLRLLGGMVLAIEVIYTMGDSKLRISEDGWTMGTRDGKISALFEQTVAVTNRRGYEVLTAI